MGFPLRKAQQGFTYADYCAWPDEERWELIHGVAYDMSPAPSPEHQRVSRRLLVRFDRFFRDGPCEVFSAPFDVRLPYSDESDDMIDTIVQPDLSVICDPAKIDVRGCRGAPDLIVEILSPSTARNDLDLKRKLYEQHGVREYWVVHPLDQFVQVFRLQPNGQYAFPQVYAADDTLNLGLFPDLEIDLAPVFGLVRNAPESSHPEV